MESNTTALDQEQSSLESVGLLKASEQCSWRRWQTVLVHLAWCPTPRVLLSGEQKPLTATPHRSLSLYSQEEKLIS